MHRYNTFIRTLIRIFSKTLLGVFVVSFVTVTWAYASGDQILGENSDIKFSIDDYVFEHAWSSVELPKFDQATGILTWNFYSKKLGRFISLSWIHMQCSWTTCQLEGNSVDDVVGTIDFSGVQYDTTTKGFHGNITTTAWNLSMEWISVSKISIQVSGIASTMTANDAVNIQIIPKDTVFYTIQQNINNIAYNSYTTHTGEVTLDLSVAWTHTITITAKDASASILGTRTVQITVIPWNISKTATPTQTANDFCRINPPFCPDGNTIQWSRVDGPNVGNVWQYISQTLKLRDQYGNKITSGNISITYKNTVKLDQIKKEWIQNTFAGGNTFEATLVGNDATYTIKSLAPTDESENILRVQTIQYNWQDITNSISLQNIIIRKPYSAQIQLPNNSISPNTPLSLQVTANGPTPDLAGISDKRIIWKLTVNSFIDYFSIDSSPNWVTDWCKANNWEASTNTYCSSPKVPFESTSVFSYEGISSPTTINARLQLNQKNSVSGKFDAIVSYSLDWNIISYLSSSTPFQSQGTTNIFGMVHPTNGALTSITSASSPKKRNDLLNQIRKNVAYLSRNLWTNQWSNYILVNGDITLDTLNPETRAYIAIGGNITLNTNILSTDKNTPIALIALSKDGVWGKIILNNSVKNIEATLFAEKSIQNSSSTPWDNQLYIVGSVFADNACNEKNADCLYWLRLNYNWEDSKMATWWEKYKFTPVIVEYNPNITLNPPPGLANIAE